MDGIKGALQYEKTLQYENSRIGRGAGPAINSLTAIEPPTSEIGHLLLEMHRNLAEVEARSDDIRAGIRTLALRVHRVLSPPLPVVDASRDRSMREAESARHVSCPFAEELDCVLRRIDAIQDGQHTTTCLLADIIDRVRI